MNKTRNKNISSTMSGCATSKKIFLVLGNGNLDHGALFVDELGQALDDSRKTEFLGTGERQALIKLMTHMTEAMTAMLDHRNIYQMDLELVRLVACTFRILNREYERIPQ